MNSGTFEVFFDRSGRIFTRSIFDLGTQESTESFFFNPNNDDFFALRGDRARSAFSGLSHISAFDVADFADRFVPSFAEMCGQCRRIDKNIRRTRAIFFERDNHMRPRHVFGMQP